MIHHDAVERAVLIGFLHLYFHVQHPEYDPGAMRGLRGRRSVGMGCEFCGAGGVRG